jgi:hypothetical protein
MAILTSTQGTRRAVQAVIWGIPAVNYQVM